MTLLLLCGGVSPEHEVSLESARHLYGLLPPPVQVVVVSSQGVWYALDRGDDLMDLKACPEEPEVSAVPATLYRRPTHTLLWREGRAALRVRGAFNIIHGRGGEDGQIQGCLDTFQVPYVGSEVLGSAICMHKGVAKRLLQQAGLPVVPFISFSVSKMPSFQEVAAVLGESLFVKPARSGSSVGVHPVKCAVEWPAALADASRYDTDLLVEKAIVGRELECAVLGGDPPLASEIGEICLKDGFYSYVAKYLDPEGAALKIAVEIETKPLLQSLAVQAFQVLCCKDLARVDFFQSAEGEVYLNEVNTLPGFTSISLYPQLWEASGVSTQALVDVWLRRLGIQGS